MKKKRRGRLSRRAQFATRQRRLTELGFLSYADYIASPLWRKRRARFFATHPRACAICEAEEGPMILHHFFYERLGEESDADLVMLCDGCHRLVHRWPHFSPSCVALMRAAFENCGDPSRPIVERELRVRNHELGQWRAAKGLPTPRINPVRIFRVDELSKSDQGRYALTPQKAPPKTVAEFERNRRW